MEGIESKVLKIRSQRKFQRSNERKIDNRITNE